MPPAVASVNTMVAPIKAMAGNVYSSIDKDLSASINYYRIKAMGNTETIYSKIVSLDNSSIANSSIKIYPTIVRDASYTVQLTNEKAGSYSLVLINMLGQSIAINSIIHAGGNASLIIQLPAKLAVGSYELLVLKDGIILKRERLVVE